MTNKLFPNRIQLPGNELSGVHHVVYNENIDVEYSQMMLDIESY